MELMQLEMFVAVIEEGSVHRAADKVCRTQPAVSIALKKLATEVGSPLFHRKHRFDYQLTPTGEILYSYATRLLCLRNEAVAALRELAGRSPAWRVVTPLRCSTRKPKLDSLSESAEN